MTTTRMALLVSSLLALFILGCATVSTGGADMQGQGAITVTGKLERIMAIGGETTGLAVTLDGSLTLGGKEYRRIEVDPGAADVQPFVGKRVEITGTVGGRKGVERGEYPVIEISGIKELGN